MAKREGCRLPDGRGWPCADIGQVAGRTAGRSQRVVPEFLADLLVQSDHASLPRRRCLPRDSDRRYRQGKGLRRTGFARWALRWPPCRFHRRRSVAFPVDSIRQARCLPVCGAGDRDQTEKAVDNLRFCVVDTGHFDGVIELLAPGFRTTLDPNGESGGGNGGSRA